MAYRCGIIWFLTLAMIACGGRVAPPEFDGQRALGYLIDQVDFGPRVPGTPASAACRDFYKNHFLSLGLAVDSQVFSFVDPYTSVDTPLVNIIARFRGDSDDERAVLLLAHYDSRPRSDHDSDPTKRENPIDGANDGASGVAVLMELANLIAQRPPRTNIDLLLVDGEDWGKEGDHDYYLLGSRHFALSGVSDKYHYCIVVDLVGDRHQNIFREKYSERFYKPLNDMVWETAARLGITTFRDTVLHEVIDDHLSLGAGGVPAINIIDFNYPHWHTSEDTPDKCSAESLANVGRVVAEIAYNRSLWPEM